MASIVVDGERDRALALEISAAHDRLHVYFVRVTVALVEGLADWQGPLYVRFEPHPTRRGEGDLIFTDDVPAQRGS